MLFLVVYKVKLGFVPPPEFRIRMLDRFIAAMGYYKGLEKQGTL